MIASIGRFFKLHWRNTVYSNVWISVCAAAFTWQGEIVLNKDSNGLLPAFAFFSTVFLYNFQRAVKLIRRSPYPTSLRNRWLSRHRVAITLWAIVGAIGASWLLMFMTGPDWIVLIIGGAVSMSYIARIGRIGGRRVPLREMPLLKIFMIAVSWAILGVLFPAVHHLNWEALISASMWISFAEKMLFIIAITIPFDIRDLEYDDLHMKTIPQLVGIPKSMWIMYGLIIGSMILVVVQVAPGNLTRPISSALFLTYLFTLFLLRKSKHKQPELYYTGWLDATILIQSLAVAAASMIQDI